jgi:hypothetical protein
MRASRFLVRLFALMLSASVAFAQSSVPPPPPGPPPAPPPDAVSATTAPQPPEFTQEQLDQMLAPIALYPDALLSQILMASTYPLEVVEAARWSRANPSLSGDAAVHAVDQYTWDPSVKSLVAFPRVLQTMEQKLEWMERLGDAFLSQQQQVMDTVQGLRQKAQAAGNLRSTDQERVESQGGQIAIEPANPAVVYVPYYDPTVVYGSWWWPAYPPVYWPVWPGYAFGPGIMFGWGIGIGVGVGFFFGGFDWGHHFAYAHGSPFYAHGGFHGGPGGAWAHDPSHRRGVPYRSAGLRQQFGRTSQSAEARNAFRGRDAGPANRAGPANGFAGRGEPAARSAAPAARAPAFNRPAETPSHAFEGVGHGSEVRSFSARGSSSIRHAAPSRPASHAAPSGHGGGQHHR